VLFFQKFSAQKCFLKKIHKLKCFNRFLKHEWFFNNIFQKLGVGKSAVRHQICHEDYRRYLSCTAKHRLDYKRISSVNHQINTQWMSKVYGFFFCQIKCFFFLWVWIFCNYIKFSLTHVLKNYIKYNLYNFVKSYVLKFYQISRKYWSIFLKKNLQAALSAFDDKRKFQDDICSNAFGHYMDGAESMDSWI